MSGASFVLMCTLELMGRSPESLPPIKLVDAPAVGASANVEGYVITGVPVIHIVTSTQAFRDADCGDRATLVKLASIIAHEEWHVRHGRDERSAYEAQLMTLMMLGAGPDTGVYHQVRRAMRHVLKAEKETRRAAERQQPQESDQPLAATVEADTSRTR